MILEASELAELRQQGAEILEETAADRCTISRGTTETRNEDSPDQIIDAPNVVEANLPCNYRLSNSSDRFLAGKQSDMNFYVVTVAAGVNVKEDDLLTILAKGADAAINLRVDAVTRKSNAVFWELICAEA